MARPLWYVFAPSHGYWAGKYRQSWTADFSQARRFEQRWRARETSEWAHFRGVADAQVHHSRIEELPTKPEFSRLDEAERGAAVAEALKEPEAPMPNLERVINTPSVFESPESLDAPEDKGAVHELWWVYSPSKGYLREGCRPWTAFPESAWTTEVGIEAAKKARELRASGTQDARACGPGKPRRVWSPNDDPTPVSYWRLWSPTLGWWSYASRRDDPAWSPDANTATKFKDLGQARWHQRMISALNTDAILVPVDFTPPADGRAKPRPEIVATYWRVWSPSVGYASHATGSGWSKAVTEASRFDLRKTAVCFLRGGLGWRKPESDARVVRVTVRRVPRGAT